MFMGYRLLVLTILSFAVAALLAFGLRENRVLGGQTRITSNKTYVVKCAPDWNEISRFIAFNDIPPIEGAGNHKWKISTNDDSAQFYFNQGMNMYYSFHIIEAMASFTKAAGFDPESPMLYWAQALTYGPNINDIGYVASSEALGAAERSNELSGNASALEKLLIQAQRARYSSDTSISREKLNQAYADKMKAIYEKHPGNADVAALYADALMLQHPWDLWNNEGQPRAWTPRIREVLEKLLARFPDHPGANHYYIHVMEASPFAEKALASAERLGKLTPALSHTVHMPSHIYLRTGHYDKGVAVNKAAIASYTKMFPLYPAIKNNDFLYVIHNLHMQANSAMLKGNSKEAVEASTETFNSIPEDYLSAPGTLGSFIQYVSMTPVLTNIRFARWNELLDMHPPDSALSYANVLYHFGRGMALARLSGGEEAALELEKLRARMKDSILHVPFTPFSAAIEGAKVAESMLEGVIAMQAGDLTGAIAAFKTAVTTEENMVYTEPRDWLLNPKHYLGDALNKAGKFVEAEKVFLKDLQNNRENGWALYGLYQAQVGQKKTTEAEKTLARFKTAFAKADVKLTSSVM